MRLTSQRLRMFAAAEPPESDRQVVTRYSFTNGRSGAATCAYLLLLRQAIVSDFGHVAIYLLVQHAALVAAGPDAPGVVVIDVGHQQGAFPLGAPELVLQASRVDAPARPRRPQVSRDTRRPMAAISATSSRVATG
jgi:hypothetical protein